MSGLFKPKAPKPPAPPAPPPPTPTVDDAYMSSEAEDKLRRRRGRAATVLSETTQGELATPATTAATTLLGS